MQRLTMPSWLIIESMTQLVGFAIDTVVPMEDNAYYALNAKNGKLGFYIPQMSTDEFFVAKAYKAYLQVPAGQDATVFFIRREDDETVIVPITHLSEELVYDLQGRVVASPVQGVYIRDGKKVIIR